MNIEESAKTNSLVLRQKALIENPDPRVPICLVLDASGSMSTVTSSGKTRLDELNAGLDQFLRELLDDTNARRAAEICIIAFSDEAQVILDFAPLTPQHLGTQIASCGGRTSLGKGVKLALDLLDRRKQEYQHAGVDYFQPWLVVITDGEPTDQTHHELVADITKRVQGKKLSVFPIAVGDVADLSQLALISPARPPIRLKGTKFREFFEWLSKSVARVSSSIPGEVVPLDKKGIDAWGEL
jgi:uncharacterized protein YegL